MDEPAGSLAGLPFKVIIMLPLEIQNRLEEIRSQIQGLGAELIDISVRRTGTRSVLAVFVDKAGGITLDECVEINRQLGVYFDEQELMQGSYYLEVSSPGLDRPLKTEGDYSRAIGQRLRLVFKGEDGTVTQRIGDVLSIKDGVVELKSVLDQTLLKLPLDSIIKAVREIKFKH